MSNGAGYDIALKIGGDIMPLQRSLKKASGEVKGFGVDVDGLAARVTKMTAVAAPRRKTSRQIHRVNRRSGVP